MAVRIIDAAVLAEASYKPHRIKSPKIIDSLDKNDVQAHLTENGLLLLPGSNSVLDYTRFNLRVFNVGGSKFRLDSKSTAPGASGTVWHQGFLKFSKTVFDWVGNRKPKLIIGHSLGAAAAQILSMSWNKPAIGFAAPRPRKGGGHAAHNGKCLLICREDDVVCTMAPSFQHMGDARFLRPIRRNLGGDHSMKQYMKVLKKNAGPDIVPTKWG